MLYNVNSLKLYKILELYLSSYHHDGASNDYGFYIMHELFTKNFRFKTFNETHLSYTLIATNVP